MQYVPIDSANQERVLAFIRSRWLSTEMVIRGTVFDMTKAEGFIALEDDGIAGLVTYDIRGDVCEILSLDSLTERRGIGTKLVTLVLSAARLRDCASVIVVMTNDNIHALRFYQKRGFDMARFYRNALNVSRSMKPEIPLIGENGIPLRHEIELEYRLQ